MQDTGSGRSLEADTFNPSHVAPEAVEKRAGPKLGRITPFPFDRTSSALGRSSSMGGKPAMSAFSEDAD